jgi:flagellar protein FliS
MTNPYAAAKAAYKDSAVTTASPARVVVMAYERLILDCERALACLETKLPAGTHLMHAQDLILALQSSLNLNAWDGAARLSTLYSHVYQELVTANIRKDPSKVTDCINLMSPLLDAWRQAELAVGAQPSSSGTIAVA